MQPLAKYCMKKNENKTLYENDNENENKTLYENDNEKKEPKR